MSADNIQFVQSLYAAFGRGDIDTIVDACAPDIRWEITGRQQDYPLLGARTGRQGVREFFGAVAELQDASDFSPREFYAADGRVFVLGHYAWTLHKTKRSVESDWIHVFTIKDRQVTSFREFTDTARFAEAARG